MPNVRCQRCGGIGYTSKSGAMIPGPMTETGMTVTVMQDVCLCTICRGKADKENTAAKRRRQYRG